MPLSTSKSNFPRLLWVAEWAPNLLQFFEPALFNPNPMGEQPTHPSTSGGTPPQKANMYVLLGCRGRIMPRSIEGMYWTSTLFEVEGPCGLAFREGYVRNTRCSWSNKSHRGLGWEGRVGGNAS